jgi:hypothetical protein
MLPCVKAALKRVAMRGGSLSPSAGHCGVLANLQWKSNKTKSDGYTAISDDRARANASSTRSGVKG